MAVGQTLSLLPRNKKGKSRLCETTHSCLLSFHLANHQTSESQKTTEPVLSLSTTKLPDQIVGCSIPNFINSFLWTAEFMVIIVLSTSFCLLLCLEIEKE